MCHSCDTFTARKSDPRWKPAPLPKATVALPRLRGKALAEVIERFNVTGFGSERPEREATPAGETVEEFMARKSDPRWKPAPLAKLFAACPSARSQRMNDRAFRAALAAYNETYGTKAA